MNESLCLNWSVYINITEISIYLSFHAHFLQFLSFDKAWHSILYQKKTDTVCCGLSFRVCDSHNNDHIRHPAVSDEHFAAIENVVITILLGIGADSLKITESEETKYSMMGGNQSGAIQSHHKS